MEEQERLGHLFAVRTSAIASRRSHISRVLAGIPTIIKPFFGDQFFWGDRVEALGVGSKIRKLTVQNISAALITATTDQKQIDKAKLVGETIRSVSGRSCLRGFC